MTPFIDLHAHQYPSENSKSKQALKTLFKDIQTLLISPQLISLITSPHPLTPDISPPRIVTQYKRTEIHIIITHKTETNQYSIRENELLLRLNTKKIKFQTLKQFVNHPDNDTIHSILKEIKTIEPQKRTSLHTLLNSPEPHIFQLNKDSSLLEKMQAIANQTHHLITLFLADMQKKRDDHDKVVLKTKKDIERKKTGYFNIPEKKGAFDPISKSITDLPPITDKGYSA